MNQSTADSMTAIWHKVKSNIGILLRFFIPPLCVACEGEIEDGNLCGDCYDQIVMTAPPICGICGRPSGGRKICPICRRLNPSFDRVRSWALFVPPLDKIVHAFKYERKPSLSKPIGRSMARILESDSLLNSTSLLVPVPLYKGRERDRGYNQAKLLSKVIQQETEKELLDCLIRTKNTPTQTKLTDAERRVNVAGSFGLRKGVSVKGKSLILIDDVLTTGATLNECASVLKQAGAEKVYGLTCAVAPVSF